MKRHFTPRNATLAELAGMALILASLFLDGVPEAIVYGIGLLVFTIGLAASYYFIGQKRGYFEGCVQGHVDALQIISDTSKEQTK